MLKIGSGAGFAGDRLDPAEILVKHADLDYLVLECLAERTIALAQQKKVHDENVGYDPLLERRIRRLLPDLIKNKVRLITNMGAANPIAGAKKILEIANDLNIPCKIAAITGDDVIDLIDNNYITTDTNVPLSNYEPIISANAYLGIDAILPALETDANIIITGRVADPSLFLAPQVYHFNWDHNDFHKLGQGTLIGHLLECAGQITGGYFADSVKKVVPNLSNLGFPFAIIDSDGRAIISKVKGTGGCINLSTVKEQLLYEVHNPSEYMTPDVIADFSTAELREVGENQVEISNARGKERPVKLKVSVGYHAGFLGEGEISYAGTAAMERAYLVEDILKERLQEHFHNLHIDLIGVSSVHRTQFEKIVPYEVRVRAAGYHHSQKIAQLIGEEVEALYTNGPAAGGGVRKKVTETIGVVSTLIDRNQVKPKITLFDNHIR